MMIYVNIDVIIVRVMMSVLNMLSNDMYLVYLFFVYGLEFVVEVNFL